MPSNLHFVVQCQYQCAGERNSGLARQQAEQINDNASMDPVTSGLDPTKICSSCPLASYLDLLTADKTAT